jgi:thiazole synthase
MLDLCLRSRDLYPDWIRKLEDLTGQNTGYWACGILAPVYQQQEQNKPQPDQTTNSSGLCLPPFTSLTWLDRAAIHHHYPGLGPEVVGGWWYPQDAQVDNRILAKALFTAVREVGVDIREGVVVEQFLQHNRHITSVQTSAGNWHAEHYILATGAWSQNVFSIPVYPKKGQMLSVRVPPATQDVASIPSLQTVLFGEEVYIVPRRDGRIVVGGTAEDVGFTPGNTPAGIQSLLSAAMRLYPALQNFPIQEFWWGFRPATPDELPILGSSPCANLTLATGHFRNGILLAPVTALLITNLVLTQQSDPILNAFHWSRFEA